MGHSIAARYAARPTARFVRPSSRARERWLGLVKSPAFSAVGGHATIIRGTQPDVLATLRGTWRGPTPIHAVVRDGRLRPSVRMRWVGPGPAVPSGSASAATAPWRD